LVTIYSKNLQIRYESIDSSDRKDCRAESLRKNPDYRSAD
jgi:hypothetical protein